MKAIKIIVSLLLSAAFTPSYSQATFVGNAQIPTSPSNPDGYFTYNSKLYFTSNYTYFYIVNSPYSALWSTDGTGIGTQPIKYMAGGNQFVSPGTNFYFVSSDPALNYAFPYALWKSDGTNAGTQMVKSFLSIGSQITNLTACNGKVFFWANNASANTMQLWVSDGTNSGTTQVKEFTQSTPRNLFSYNNKVYFAADDGIHGVELWTSDGTVGNTIMLKDICTVFPFSSNPDNFFIFNNTLYFSANNGTVGTELWSTDGSSINTTLFKDINPGINSSSPNELTFYNNKFFFRATGAGVGTELFSSDGTAANTGLVKDINIGNNDSYPTGFTVYNSILYFMASDGVHGNELWRTDGSNLNTSLVSDVNPGPQGTQPYQGSLGVANGLLFFVADDGVHGHELWKTDGTNTSLVSDILPGSNSSLVNNGTFPRLVAFNNKINFKANDGIRGFEPWVSDGTTASILKDANPGGIYIDGYIAGQLFPSLSSSYEESKRWITTPNYILFSGVNATGGVEPWISNGTATSTMQLKDIFAGTSSSDPNGFTLYDGKTYFTANDQAYFATLWATDGTAAGTQKVVPTLFNLSQRPSNMIVYNNKLYFSSGNLFISDGTSAGTVVFLNLNMGKAKPIILNNLLYFTANDGINGEELWVTDGDATLSVAHTHMVANINPTGDASISSLTVYNNKLYFAANDGTNGTELWKSDGTAGGTSLVSNINNTLNNNGNSTPYGFTIYNSMLYFAADNGQVTGGFNGTFTLFKTDGINVQMVKRINPTGDAALFGFTVFNNKLYFSADNGTNGYELWQSDGTDAGTSMVQDVMPGITGSAPFGLTVFNNRLYFSSNDSLSGYEPRYLDVSNTIHLVQDIQPGTAGSTVQPYVIMNNQLYFWASEETHGGGLWKINSSPLPLKLLSFAGKLTNKNDALLEWTSVNEFNFSNYTIERSSDGMQFITIGHMNGKGGGYYTYDDPNLSPGHYFYRLKMVDIDGNSTYSNVVPIIINISQEISISPNPVQSVLFIQSSSRILQWTITDAIERIVLKGYENTGRINTSSLSPGHFLIKIMTVKGEKTISFIKI